MIPEALKESAAYGTLRSIIDGGRIPHSFMIEGGNLTDRKQTALYLAKCIICENEVKPCDNCRMCKTAEDASNPDVISVFPEDKKKSITVAQIRNMRADAFVRPHSANKKIYIIENAELMNEQAQNALLKVLEEPPATVVFILLTPSRTYELETIVSRCSILKISGDTDSDLSEAQSFISLLFEGKYYELLKILKAYEKDRKKAEEFFLCIKEECVKEISSGTLSNYRAKILSKIYEQTDPYIVQIQSNVNMPLLASAAVCRYKSFLS